MIIILVQNTNIDNKWKWIHNYFKNVPNKKKFHFANDFNNILFVATKDNDIFEL
jgi:hypothetical protein